MASPEAVPRILLRQLRRIMAEPGSGQDRLNKIVQQIATLMVAEVCSLYIRRQDGSLELFATEGLNSGAVHTTFMKRGEGLVGLSAEQAKTVNLSEAQSHPAFSYRPETGEEVYQSFLGVPVLRAGKVLGVLTVQNKIRKSYLADDEEALQTTAMVLAEHLASGDVAGFGSVIPLLDASATVVIKGQGLSDGIALGHVVLHAPRVVVSELIADDIEAEQARLADAIERLRGMVDGMLARREIAFAGEHRDVLEAYQMFANDRGWLERLRVAVASGLTAEAAAERVRNDMRARMLRRNESYWHERFRDFEDLSDRLVRLLSGWEGTAAEGELPADAILVARTMGPAELLDYDRSRLRGLIIEEGGQASHVAIVAKALGIPALGHARGVVETAEPGDAVVVDADAGEAHIRPAPDVIAAYSDKVRFRARRQRQYSEFRDQPAITRDGVKIGMHINAGLLVDLPHLSESGADGIGLFRTELEFMISSRFPLRERQQRIYEQIFAAVGDRPVVFRMLDIGGDKMLPYFRHAREENPALGWRAIRMALDRHGLFRTQMQALLRAAAGRELRLMLPMVSTVGEVREARGLIDYELEWLQRRGHPAPRAVKLGVMIEVPALVWQLDGLAGLADFLSIGSNDLLQFLFAADRNNERVAKRFDPLSPPVLRILKDIVQAAERNAIPLTLCGEMSGRPLEAMALIGAGLRSISMAPANIGPVKAMIMTLHTGRLSAYVDQLSQTSAPSVRENLKRFAVAEGVSI